MQQPPANVTSRRNMAILFFSMVVVMLGFGMILPILPFYVEYFGASGSALGLLMAIYGIMQFVFAPLWGKLSDRVGRKPVLLLGIFGNAVTQVVFGLATSLEMLFVVRALAGVLASATLPTAMAYISDSTSEEDRGGGMGVLGAAMGLGMVFGPGIGGWLAQNSLSFPFFIAGALSLLSFGLAVVFLPESLPVSERTEKGEIHYLDHFREMGQALYGPIGFLLVLAFLLNFGLTNFEGVFGLYAKDRFGYGTLEVGLILMFMGLLSALIQGGLTGRLTRRFGEVAIIRWSMASSAVAFVAMIFATTLPGILLTIGAFILSNTMLRPAVSSLTSKRTTGGQGMAMGLSNSFMSLGRVVGPGLAGFLFDIRYFLPYLVGGVVMLVGYWLCLVYLETRQESQPAATLESA